MQRHKSSSRKSKSSWKGNKPHNNYDKVWIYVNTLIQRPFCWDCGSLHWINTVIDDPSSSHLISSNPKTSNKPFLCPSSQPHLLFFLQPTMSLWWSVGLHILRLYPYQSLSRIIVPLLSSQHPPIHILFL